MPKQRAQAVRKSREFGASGKLAAGKILIDVGAAIQSTGNADFADGKFLEFTLDRQRCLFARASGEFDVQSQQLDLVLGPAEINYSAALLRAQDEIGLRLAQPAFHPKLGFAIEGRHIRSQADTRLLAQVEIFGVHGEIRQFDDRLFSVLYDDRAVTNIQAPDGDGYRGLR